MDGTNELYRVTQAWSLARSSFDWSLYASDELRRANELLKQQYDDDEHCLSLIETAQHQLSVANEATRAVVKNMDAVLYDLTRMMQKPVIE